MARLDIERQQELEPKRVDYAVKELEKIGKKITFKDETKIIFEHEGESITLYPYSGWFTGKGIKDGRGISKLLKQMI